MNQEETKNKELWNYHTLFHRWGPLCLALHRRINFVNHYQQVPQKGNLMKKLATKSQSPPAGGPYKKGIKGMPCPVFPRSTLPAFQPFVSSWQKNKE
jgi:hypothetical protein